MEKLDMQREERNEDKVQYQEGEIDRNFRIAK